MGRNIGIMEGIAGMSRFSCSFCNFLQVIPMANENNLLNNQSSDDEVNLTVHEALVRVVDSGSQAVVEQVANYFRVLGEPMRLKLLNVLRDGERCVQDLVDETQTSQANVSKHLKVMLQAGILAKRSQGTQAFYRVTDDLIFELCNLVCDRLATRIEQQAQHFRTFSLASKPESDIEKTAA
jgi:DNA-binding transcriptional ArsR family regulator